MLDNKDLFGNSSFLILAMSREWIWNMEKVKVLAVLSGLSAGGAETMYINLYRNMNKERFAVDFLIFGNDDAFYADEVKKSGSKIFKMDYVQKSGINGFCNSIKRCICENGPYDVVHSHIDYLSGYVMKVAKKCNVKIRLAHSHSTYAHTHRGSISGLLMVHIRRMINKYATGLLACSTEAAKYMFGNAKANSAVVINNAIDLNRFSDKGQYSDINFDFQSAGKKIILHIGRFTDPKNHETLIDIFDKYLTRNSNSLLLLAGEGELKDKIVHLVEKKGLQNDVKFLGVRADIPQLLAVADVFVLPSKFEGVPVTLIEAQAMNVPCVVSDNIKKVVDCELDLISFVPLDDVNLWAVAIKQAIEKRTSRDNYTTMTDCGYNIEKNIDIIEQLYLQK